MPLLPGATRSTLHTYQIHACWEDTMKDAWDADGHVDEWEGTFSDEYLDPKFRDQRPTVVNANAEGTYFSWDIPGRGLFRVGSSPSSKGGVNAAENVKLSRWRGSMESGEFRSAAARAELLDAENTYLQVNYPTLLLAHPLTGDAALNQALTRSYNNWIADISNQDADRFKWVTVIDPSDPKAAAKEIERTKDMGSVGVMVFGVYENKAIDHSDFEPIWAAAQDTGLPLAVHPGRSAMALSDTYDDFAEHQFHFSVLMGFKRIMVSGILDRFPGVKVGFLETGCTWVDFMVEQTELVVHDAQFRAELGATRAEHDALIAKGLPDMTPDEYIKAGRVFLGFEVNEAMLPYVIDRWGADCWVYASDIPHGHRILDSPGYLMGRTDVPEDAKQKLLRDNVAKFYGLTITEEARVGGAS
jgi:predicted TIM-barrel fold metal-dependent hydrolase